MWQKPHGDDCVQIAPDSLGVSGVEIGFGGLEAGVLHQRFHGRVDLIQLVESVNVGDVARIQNVV